MKAWLLTIGEPLPTDADDQRLLRTGLLAGTLAPRGHSVLWWTSAFNHTSKTFRSRGDSEVSVVDGQRIVLLDGGGYNRNVSLARLRDHARLARRFAAIAPTRERPDVIVASLPSIELALAAATYGQKYRVPVIVDVRDLWPDSMVDLLPPFARPVGNAIVAPLRRQVRRACADAAALTGSSRMFLDWALRQADRPETALDRVFPHGYPVQPITEHARARALATLVRHGFDVSPTRTTAAFIGTVGKQFDLDPVIEAASILRDDARMQFVVAGVGERLQRYRRAAATLPNVKLTGWLDRSEIAVLLEHATAGLLAYENRQHWIESTPNKFAEYLSGGLPVLISLDRGEMLTFAERHGCGTTYAHSGRRLADAMRRLADSPETVTAFRVAARTAFTKHFRADAVYSEMADYLDEVVNAGQFIRG